MNSIEWNSRRAPLRRYFENSYRRHQFFKVRRRHSGATAHLPTSANEGITEQGN